MSEWLSDLRYRLRALFRKGDLERELDAELQLHLELEAAKLEKAGLLPGEAMRRARLSFGGVSRIKDDSRDTRGLTFLETLGGDLRYAFRRLAGEPGFTAVTVLTLAIGIGGTAAIFSAVHPILFAPLPYPEAGRIVVIQERGADGTPADGTFGMYLGYAGRARSLDAVAVFKGWQPAATGGGQPERLEGQRVSAGYFRVLGVSPVLGRPFLPEEDRPNGGDVVILSEGLWRRRYSADPAIIGQAVTLNGNPFTVVGVMPRDFENVLAPAAEAWAPLQYDLSQGRAWGHHLRTVARLKQGTNIEVAALELDALAHAVVQEQQPGTYSAAFSVAAVALRDDVVRGVKPALLAVTGAMALVLIIACVNVTNLLLARGVRRRPEFALRASLGAGHQRLVRQMLTESLLLAFLGGAVGMIVATGGVRALIALSPPELVRLPAIGVNGPVFLFALAVSTLVGLAFGVAPAVHAARSDPQQALQGAARGSTGAHQGLRGALVVAEVALALVLLVSSGLLVRSLQRLFAVDSGFDAAHVLTMQVQAVGPAFTDQAALAPYFGQVLEAVRRVPGVTSAAFTSQLPMSGDLDLYGVHFDMSPTEVVEGGSTFRYSVSPGYVETMRLALRRGRAFDDRDVAGAPLVALLSESYAKRIFGDADPVGRRFRIGPDTGPQFTIVGVVGDVRQQSLAMSQADAVYLPEGQWLFPDNVRWLVVRTSGDPLAQAAAVRQAAWSADRDQPVVRVAALEDLVAASAAERRFALVLFEAFALAALILAAAGIYGVLAGRVAERTREIGVRTALGATRGTIVGLVVRQGMALTGLGVAIGLAGAMIATRALVAMLFDVSRLDPVTYIGVVALLVVVSLVACAVPAWRAARVDPVTTLRIE